MKRTLFISAILLLPFTGAYAGINPFKPYKPLKEIDYSQNLALGKDPSSIAYKPYSFTEKSLLPIGPCRQASYTMTITWTNAL